MNVVIGSAWRNSQRNVYRYMKQVAKLRERMHPHTVEVIAVEGDSVDHTYHVLRDVSGDYRLPLRLVKHDTNAPHFPSTEQPERMKALSGVGNAILDAVEERDDVLVYVESDLIWDAESINHLIDEVTFDDEFNIVAPLVFAGDCFYDVWAFRGLDGERFSPFRPYHSSFRPEGMTEVSSVGSCLCMRGETARDRRVRMKTGALVEYCAVARAHGYTIAAHADLKVTHP